MYKGPTTASIAVAHGFLLGTTANCSSSCNTASRCGEGEGLRVSKPVTMIAGTSRHGCHCKWIASLCKEKTRRHLLTYRYRQQLQRLQHGFAHVVVSADVQQGIGLVAECIPFESGRHIRHSGNGSASMRWRSASGQKEALGLTMARTPVLYVAFEDRRHDGETSLQGNQLIRESANFSESAVCEGSLEAVSVGDVEGARMELAATEVSCSESAGTSYVRFGASLVAIVEDGHGLRQDENDGSHSQLAQAIVREEDEVDGRCSNYYGPPRTRVPTASLSQALTQATGRVLSYTIGAVARPISRGNSGRGPAAIAVAVAVAVVLGVATVVKAREEVTVNQKACTSCAGRGVEACSVCGGEGHICWEGKCNRDTPCPACLGSGSQKCHTCHGVRRKRVSVQSAAAAKAVEESLPM